MGRDTHDGRGAPLPLFARPTGFGPRSSVRQPMRSHPQTMELYCAECGCASDETARGWRAYFGSTEDYSPIDVFTFCPECAAREFDTFDVPQVNESRTD